MWTTGLMNNNMIHVAVRYMYRNMLFGKEKSRDESRNMPRPPIVYYIVLSAALLLCCSATVLLACCSNLTDVASLSDPQPRPERETT